MADLDYFIHTPTIFVGVDYNVKDHVDYAVGIFSTHNEVDVVTGVKDWICNQHGLITGKVRGSPTLRLQLDDDNKLGIPDDLYHRMYCYVKAKWHLSMNGFRSRPIQQMTRAGCVIKGVGGSLPISTDGFLRLSDMRGELSAAQRASVHKHALMRAYDVKSHDIVTAEWVKTYGNKREKEIYRNLVALSPSAGSSLQECLQAVRQREDLSLEYSVRGATSAEAHTKVEKSQYVKLECVIGIMVACGYEDTFATNEVLAENLKERIDGIWLVLKDKMSDICTSIKKRRPTSNDWTFKNKLAFINMILHEVLGAKIA
ncbi:hypothetical protein BG011_009670 [Mortierella polycephala]|uniref:Uncharacterized protein n=1 Tax=Mortierella polycephala TaxID=41804 RepID=A0A9P6PMI3_9FUNG|nr:hypothetical protein BG011_009670 [Mortierella polycephala]